MVDYTDLTRGIGGKNSLPSLSQTILKYDSVDHTDQVGPSLFRILLNGFCSNFESTIYCREYIPFLLFRKYRSYKLLVWQSESSLHSIVMHYNRERSWNSLEKAENWVCRIRITWLTMCRITWQTRCQSCARRASVPSLNQETPNPSGTTRCV